MKFVSRTVAKLVDKADPNDPFSVSYDTARELLADKQAMRYMPVMTNHREGPPAGLVERAFIFDGALYHVGNIDESTPHGQSVARMVRDGSFHNVSLSHLRADAKQGRPLARSLELTLCSVPGRRDKTGVIMTWEDSELKQRADSIPEQDRFERPPPNLVAASDESGDNEVQRELEYYSKLLPSSSASSNTTTHVPQFNNPSTLQTVITTMASNEGAALSADAGAVPMTVDTTSTKTPEEEEEQRLKKQQPTSATKLLEEKLDRFERLGEEPDDIRTMPDGSKEDYALYLQRKLADDSIFRGQSLINRALRLFQQEQNKAMQAENRVMEIEKNNFDHSVNVMEPTVKKWSHRQPTQISMAEWKEAVRQRDWPKVKGMQERMAVLAASDEAENSAPAPAPASVPSPKSSVSPDELQLFRLRKEAAEAEERAEKIKQQNLATQRGMEEKRQKESQSLKIADEMWNQRMEHKTRQQQQQQHTAPPPQPQPPAQSGYIQQHRPPTQQPHQSRSQFVPTMDKLMYFQKHSLVTPEEMARLEQEEQNGTLRFRSPEEFAQQKGYAMQFQQAHDPKYRFNPGGVPRYTSGMISASQEDMARSCVSVEENEAYKFINHPFMQLLDKVSISAPGQMFEAKWTTPHWFDRSRMSDRGYAALHDRYDPQRGQLQRLNPRRMFDSHAHNSLQQMRHQFSV